MSSRKSKKKRDGELMKIEVLGGYGGESLGYRMTCLLINDTIALDAGSLSQALPIERQVDIGSILLTHSHIDHLITMLEAAASGGARRLYVHVLLDGRDVPGQSALEYVDRLEETLAALRSSGVDAAIASGGGRMHITMDRYEADWPMVERGYNVHVHGLGRRFKTARAAIEQARQDDPEISDQYLPEFVIERDGEAVGAMKDGDAAVFFNFRGDRAIEFSMAMENDDFTYFDRGARPDVLYTGMMEYDGDARVPSRYLVEPPAIERTMGEFLSANGVSQLAISETQKFGHVTYFWNGNRSGAFDDKLEHYVEIPSDTLPFEERPWMKAAEITDRLLGELESGQFRCARLNYANGDMVGHTGDFDSTVIAVEAVDLQLGRLMRWVKERDGVLVVTADHGNADEMYFHDKVGAISRDAEGRPRVRPSHSLNQVPFVVFDPARHGAYALDLDRASRPGIANVAAICYELLGYTPPVGLEPSLLAIS